jgi:hypothetical protein
MATTFFSYICAQVRKDLRCPPGAVRLLSANCYQRIPTWPKELGRQCKYLMGLVGEGRRFSRPGVSS